jgi:hypothetical protein
MAAKREKELGRITVEVELANNDDLAAARRGDLAGDKVRRLKMRGVVAPNSTRLMLPTQVAKKLGLRVTGQTKVCYGNGRKNLRDVVDVYLELRGRHGLYRARLEPRKGMVTIGKIVLNDLDFLVDHTKGRLSPRDAKFVVVEIG